MGNKYSVILADLGGLQAIGDGNCAFNGYALSLADGKKLAFIKAHFEKYNQDMGVYEHIVKIIQQVGSDHNLLQKQMAPFLRRLAIQLIQKQPERYFKGSLFNLESVFSTGLRDDIYCAHSFIRNKFAELRKLPPKDQSPALANWWQTEGFSQFLEAMKRDGVDSGDLELVALSDYFGVVFLLKADRYGEEFVCLNAANGEIPSRGELSDHRSYRFSTVQIKELTQRGIVQRPNGLAPLQWEPLSRETVEERLSAVPSYQEVHDYIATKKPAKGAPVPDAWKANSNLLEQLKIRGVVTNGVFTKNNVNAEELAFTLRRIGEVENKALVMSLWDETFIDAPFIALQNKETLYKDGKTQEEFRIGHWDAIVSMKFSLTDVSKAIAEDKAKGKEKEEKEKPKKPYNKAFFTETLQILKSGKLKPSESKWKQLVDQVQQEEAAVVALPEDEKIQYDFNGKVKEVSKTIAEALDEELAKRLQLREYEEYQAYLESCKPTRSL